MIVDLLMSEEAFRGELWNCGWGTVTISPALKRGLLLRHRLGLPSGERRASQHTLHENLYSLWSLMFILGDVVL